MQLATNFLHRQLDYWAVYMLYRLSTCVASSATSSLHLAVDELIASPENGVIHTSAVAITSNIQVHSVVIIYSGDAATGIILARLNYSASALQCRISHSVSITAGCYSYYPPPPHPKHTQ